MSRRGMSFFPIEQSSLPVPYMYLPARSAFQGVHAHAYAGLRSNSLCLFSFPYLLRAGGLPVPACVCQVPCIRTAWHFYYCDDDDDDDEDFHALHGHSLRAGHIGKDREVGTGKTRERGV